MTSRFRHALEDKNGKILAKLGADEGGHGLTVNGENGKVIWSQP